MSFSPLKGYHEGKWNCFKGKALANIKGLDSLIESHSIVCNFEAAPKWQEVVKILKELSFQFL